MAYLNTTHVPSFFDRIRTAASAVATRFAQHRKYRATLNELSVLTDRELADLGLSRAGLHIIARESAKN